LNLTIQNSVIISINVEEQDSSMNSKNSSVTGYSIISFGIVVLLMLLFGCGNSVHNEQIHKEVSIALGFQHPDSITIPSINPQVEPISEEEIYRLLGLDYPNKTIPSSKTINESVSTLVVDSTTLTEELPTNELEGNEFEGEEEELGNEKCIDLSILPPCLSCLWCLRAYLLLFITWALGIIGVHFYLVAQRSVLPLAQASKQYRNRNLMKLIKKFWFKD